MNKWVVSCLVHTAKDLVITGRELYVSFTRVYVTVTYLNGSFEVYSSLHYSRSESPVLRTERKILELEVATGFGLIIFQRLLYYFNILLQRREDWHHLQHKVTTHSWDNEITHAGSKDATRSSTVMRKLSINSMGKDCSCPCQ